VAFDGSSTPGGFLKCPIPVRVCAEQKLLTFCLLLWNYLQILKIFTETLHKIIFCVIGQFSSAGLLLAAGKMCNNKPVTGGFWHDFTESQAASSMQFKCENGCFRGFEAGYRKDFQHY
jgi:hypothetical protein